MGVILLLDVLEHLEDPAAFLSALRPAFPNLRAAVVTVPARQELWSAWDVRFGHQRRFDLPSLAALCADAGWQVQSMRYFFHALYPVLLGVSRIVGRGTRAVPPRGRSALHGLLARLFSFEAGLPVGGIVGSSLIAVVAPSWPGAPGAMREAARLPAAPPSAAPLPAAPRTRGDVWLRAGAALRRPGTGRLTRMQIEPASGARAGQPGLAALPRAAWVRGWAPALRRNALLCAAYVLVGHCWRFRCWWRRFRLGWTR